MTPTQPERIKGESQGAVVSYSAASDVWSLGLTIIEAAVGHYPYPPETYQNVFAQLTAIVHGEAPTLPESYSAKAHEFVELCLRKDATQRPTYQQLLVRPHSLSLSLSDSPRDCPRELRLTLTPFRCAHQDHPFLSDPALADVDMAGWVAESVEYRKEHPKVSVPALA